MRRRLRAAYAVFCVFTALVFHLLFVRGILPHGFISIPLLLIAPLGCALKKGYAYLLAGLSFALVFGLSMTVYRTDWVSAGLPALVFGCLVAGFTEKAGMTAAAESEWASRLKKAQAAKAGSQKTLEGLNAAESETREKESSIIRLYEITKKMSASLRFDDIFDIFSVFLKENFTFRKCALVILKADEAELKADRVYKVWGPSVAEALPQGVSDLDYGSLAGFFSDGRKELFLRRPSQDADLDRLGLDSGVKTFLAVPLMSEMKVVGILAVEGLPAEDHENFAILATQFALEIKKVLLYEKVEELAITDALTGLYVRRYFLSRLNEELHRSKRYKFRCAFLMIDIDGFKNCNDSFGHLVGDVVLRDVARLMRESVREIDLVARYGGEEFSVVLPETGRSEARIVAERVRKRIEENDFRAYDETLKMTISVGVSAYPDDSSDADGLIEAADEALYAAKAAGKNIVCEYGKGYRKRT